MGTDQRMFNSNRHRHRHGGKRTPAVEQAFYTALTRKRGLPV